MPTVKPPGLVPSSLCDPWCTFFRVYAGVPPPPVSLAEPPARISIEFCLWCSFGPFLSAQLRVSLQKAVADNFFLLYPHGLLILFRAGFYTTGKRPVRFIANRLPKMSCSRSIYLPNKNASVFSPQDPLVPSAVSLAFFPPKERLLSPLLFFLFF